MQRPSHWLRLATSLILAILLLLPSLATAQDRIYPITGPRASGKIKTISPASIVIEVKGKDQTYPVHEVRKVSFDEEPKELDRARDQVLNKQYDQALEELRKIGEVSQPLVKQDVDFYRWYCEGKLGLAGNGDKNAAIRGLLAIASANRNTHHLYELSELLGQLAMAVNKPTEAIKYFGLLSRSPDATTQARGVYQLGNVYLLQNKADEAAAEFAKVSKVSANTPDMVRLKSLTKIGQALVDNIKGDSAKALKSLDDMIKKNDSTDHELFARISNAKGAIHQKMNKPQRAALDYLHTDLMFFTDAEAHAEALYHLSQLWPQLGEAARAAEARERLIKNYAASTWAAKL